MIPPASKLGSVFDEFDRERHAPDAHSDEGALGGLQDQRFA